MCKQVLKNGICISESLGFCKGCEKEFFKELKEHFTGIFIKSSGEVEVF